MNALVLSGGGGMGAYQIGVWQALRKLNYKIDIVTGTSVGALNGLLITQNNYILAPLIWKNIDYSSIFDTTDSNLNHTGGILKMYGNNIIKNNGMDVTRLEEKIKKLINYKKFYNSKINYGLTTYNLSNHKPEFYTKKQIPKDKLKDYLMASATCFPAFKIKYIDNKKYIDGGYYDVLPINLASNMGATNIIAVDLKAIGIRRKNINKNLNITYIYPRNNIGNSLTFSKKINKQNLNYGYNDTLKTFNVLEGNKYTFQQGTIKQLKNIYQNSFSTNVNRILKNACIDDIDYLNKYLNKSITDKKLIELIEKINLFFELSEHKIYGIKELKRNLIVKFSKKIKISNTLQKVYNAVENKNKRNIKRFAIVYPKEFIYLMFIYTIKHGVYNNV